MMMMMMRVAVVCNGRMPFRSGSSSSIVQRAVPTHS
jgi:hypothetical protein